MQDKRWRFLKRVPSGWVLGLARETQGDSAITSHIKLNPWEILHVNCISALL